MSRIFFSILLLTACGDGDETQGVVAGERCKTDSSSACGANIYESLLCVSGKWEVQQTCDRDSELCVVSVGEAVCSVGGEPCDSEGDTQCVDDAIQQSGFQSGFATWHVLQCDGRAWELYNECDSTCSLTDGEATCD